MADVLIRNLDEKTVSIFKARARKNSRSLQAELAAVLEAEAELQDEAAWDLADRIRQELAGRKHTSSVELIRQDRAR